MKIEQLTQKDKKFLKELYDNGMKALRDHSEEICARVIRGRNENGGNFKYLEDEDIQRETKLAQILKIFLYRSRLILQDRTDIDGLCRKKCMNCWHPRHNFHAKKTPEHWANNEPEHWYCQEECECK